MDFTLNELLTIKHALQLRSTKMLDYVDAYKSQNNPEGQKDAFNEFRITNNLSDKVDVLIKTLTPSEKKPQSNKERQMIANIKRYGEDEGSSHRIWLSDLNGKCDIDGHTDIMSVVACKNTAGEDCISVQVNTPDDSSTLFVGIEDFSKEVADAIYNQIMNQKK